MVGGNDRDFGTIRVVLGDWPILVIEFAEQRSEDAVLRAMLEHLESVMTDAARSHAKIFIVSDLTRMRELPPASQRQIAGHWGERTTALSRVVAVGSATVTPSPILRGTLTAVFWLCPPPRPVFFLSTRSEAFLKGIELLEAEKVELPPRLVGYRAANARGA